jgi:ABC-type branched-subunit amino acid transport system ATPase component
VLESIHDTIGGKVRLPRNELLDLIETSINEKEVVVITGEPMMGKSVLLKLLANRLKSEGGVIALSVERLSGTTIENFLHNIHIQNDFRNIIFATGTAPLRCILIDGLERVRGDEDRRRVLNDLITEVRKYNKSIISKGGHRDNCWKIIFTCRALDAIDVLRNLETRKNLADNSLEMVKVGSLSDDEVAEVVDQLPKLKELASQGHLKEILSLPLILDLLTRPDIPQLASEEIPPVLTETWLLDWFWKEVVRLGDGLRSGKGNPDTRERLLINIARQSLKSDNLMTVSEDMDFEAVSGLVSDRLLIREDNHIRFAHDVYEDWTLTILLKHHNRDVPGFLTEIGEPLRLVRAFRLYASRLLEVEQTPNAWSNLLTALEGKDTLSPRWYQIALTAPLFSPLLNEILPRIQPFLFENDAALLSKFLKALRTICVQPSPNVYTTFGDLPPAELEKYLAYWTIPIWTQWAPVIQLVLQNPLDDTNLDAMGSSYSIGITKSECN